MANLLIYYSAEDDWFRKFLPSCRCPQLGASSPSILHVCAFKSPHQLLPPPPLHLLPLLPPPILPPLTLLVPPLLPLLLLLPLPSLFLFSLLLYLLFLLQTPKKLPFLLLLSPPLPYFPVFPLLPSPLSLLLVFFSISSSTLSQPYVFSYGASFPGPPLLPLTQCTFFSSFHCISNCFKK